ncbi:biotrophy-associated secreted protein 2 [Colletotrichum nymphaeae SA-01]|uniref:Biotrophy-associated secreted protein 2 n=1 Tax=Colletotrichum nymphaeae SA-01 TaxID=1460502 RepID=A0A135UJJ4_9PEZI|nr:biotrophy-associated secreted protein 2 [Colletotrichum nymphaeae SA-01]
MQKFYGDHIFLHLLSTEAGRRLSVLQLAVALVQGLESAFRPVCRSPMFRPIRNISTTGTASSATQFSNLSLDNLTGPRCAMVSDHLVSWGFDSIRIAGWRSRILTALLRNEKRKITSFSSYSHYYIMVRFSLAAAFFAASALAIPSPLTPDPSGDKNVGNGNGVQFIGGACLNSKDCASTCCATLNGAGICSGLGAQFQAGKTGCGFGDGGAAAAPAASQGAGQAAPSMEAAAGSGGGAGSGTSSNVGAGNGQQFITGQCLSDADCASGCCNGPKGACAARAVATENGKAGCGFTGTGAGAATGSTGGGAAAEAAAPPQAAPSAGTDAGSGAGAGTSGAPGSQNVGKGNGQQFITGQCLSNADCASGCCAGPKGVCSATAVANESGKTGCGFTAA